jgi:molybdate transport system permease protein
MSKQSLIQKFYDLEINREKILQKIKGLRFKHYTFVFVILVIIFILSTVGCIFARLDLDALKTNLTSREILFAINLSLWTSTLSTFACILIATPVAYSLARLNFRGKNLVNTIVDLPMALPPLVAGVGLLLLFGTTDFGNFLSSLGIQFVFTIWGIILAQFFVNLPLSIRIMRATFIGIDPRYENVAKTLGCSGSSAFLRVTLPMAEQGILASITLTWSRAIGEFGATLMLAGAMRLKTETLPISIYLNMSCGDMQLAIAAAIILIFISFISLYICEKFTKIPNVY